MSLRVTIAQDDWEPEQRANKLRNRLTEAVDYIVDLYAALPDEAFHHASDHEFPGGDALHLHGPAANLQAWENQYEAAEDAGGPDYAGDQVDTDAHPLLVLTSEAEHLRELRNKPTDLNPTLERAAAFLAESLDWMTDHNQHTDGIWPGMEQLIKRLQRVVKRLENVERDGERHEWAEVACLACGSALKRRMVKRKPGKPTDKTDRGGIEDNYWCDGCRRHLAPHEFYLAAAQDAQLSLGVADDA